MNLKSFFTIIALVPNLFTVVDQAVVSVEQSLPGFKGSDKLAAAEAKLNGWLTTAGVDISAITGLSGILQPLINTAVAAFNAARAFVHSGSSTTSTSGTQPAAAQETNQLAE